MNDGVKVDIFTESTVDALTLVSAAEAVIVELENREIDARLLAGADDGSGEVLAMLVELDDEGTVSRAVLGEEIVDLLAEEGIAATVEVSAYEDDDTSGHDEEDEDDEGAPIPRSPGGGPER